MSLQRWTNILAGHSADTHRADEAAALETCRLALRAAEQGTYGVGAVLLDTDGGILLGAHNEVHIDDYRSDLHAEMVLINAFEKTLRKQGIAPTSLTLVSSLEPCPMCMTRLIFAGIGTIKHVCDDDIGGMVQRKQQLPPVFQELTEALSQRWQRADCSTTLREAAFHIWDESRATLDRSLANERPHRNT